jgi:hypothetical protein
MFSGSRMPLVPYPSFSWYVGCCTDPLALRADTEYASACPEATTTSYTSEACPRALHSTHTCATCGHTHPSTSLPAFPATTPSAHRHGRAARAAAALLAVGIATALGVLSATPLVRSRLQDILPDQDDPCMRRRRQPGCFESNTPRIQRW